MLGGAINVNGFWEEMVQYIISYENENGEKNLMKEQNKTTVYEPDNSIKKGYFYTVREISNELKNNKWLIYQLFKRDFLAMYKQSFIGVFWAVIIPLVSAGTFILLNQSGVFSVGNISVPYPIYAMLGVAFWQIFSAGIINSSNSLVKAGSMVVKINFSKKALVIASWAQVLVSFLVQLILIGVLFICYHKVPTLAVFLLPIVLIPLSLLALGMGFILSLMNGIFRDIGNILSISMTFLMFLTPVLYSKPESGILAVITKYNPLYYLISAPRDIVLLGRISNIEGFFISGVMGIVVFMLCIVTFHIAETRIAERV
jgi:lipopolysaccharide transport system permease protein